MKEAREHPTVAAAIESAVGKVSAATDWADVARLAWRVEELALDLRLLPDGHHLDIRPDLVARRQELRAAGMPERLTYELAD